MKTLTTQEDHKMRPVRYLLISIIFISLSGCAGFGFQEFTPGPPSATSMAFIDRFPENLQGVVIIKPEDADATIDYYNSIWEGDSGSYKIRITGIKKMPYVALMLPPGRYKLKRLVHYSYWLDLKKAIISADGKSYLGEPSFEVISGEVTYLGDVKVSSSPIRSLVPSFSGNKLITTVEVNSDFDNAVLFARENYPNLVKYMKAGLISASGDVIKLGGNQ